MLLDELVWHRDRNDREVTIVQGDNWQIQLDNLLPMPLKEGQAYIIPSRVFHRLIKGTNTLVIEINEKPKSEKLMKITKRQLKRIIREAIKDEPIRMASGDSFSRTSPGPIPWQKGSSEYRDTIVMSPNADSVLVNGAETYIEDVPQELSIASGFPMSDIDSDNLIFALEDQMSDGHVELGVAYENGKWSW